MGSICSKEFSVHDYVAENEGTDKGTSKSSVQVIASLHEKEAIEDGGYKKTRIIERPKNGYRKRSTSGLGRVSGTQQEMFRVIGVPHSARAEQVAAAWPSWLASVAGEAIRGWTPRSPDSYEKINKIGQGTYSSVYRARDLATDKIVALKKVRFVNMDPESVRFMAREICILRRLDHPNVMKLEAIVTSKISGSLYLVFEYMEHDLAGLLALPKVNFTEPQIKCYAQQMFLGLEYCHSHGVLHRDIKGSNLLVDKNGILKIGDFGLATFFEPNQRHPLTSHVVTLWYRAPELLLGETHYGVEIDMWSAGCILAELFAGKPIMPGRTEVEQMHKIFKLCGSPIEEYWTKSRLPHATSFKSQRPYKRRVADVFRYFPSSALALVEVLLSIDPEMRGTASSALRSDFFTSSPLPCDPSSLPKHPPSKEFDAKLREEEVRRQKADNLKGHGAENGGQPNQGTIEKNNETGFNIELEREKSENVYSHSSGVIRQIAVGYSSPGKVKAAQITLSSSRQGAELARQGSQLHGFVIDSSNYHSNGAHGTSNNGSIGYVAKRNRMFCSGPLMRPGGNIEDMLKDHEREIQEAVRKSRKDKSKAK